MSDKKERLFKVLDKGRAAYHGGSGKWPLRKWVEVEESTLYAAIYKLGGSVIAGGEDA